MCTNAQHSSDLPLAVAEPKVVGEAAIALEAVPASCGSPGLHTIAAMSSLNLSHRASAATTTKPQCYGHALIHLWRPHRWSRRRSSALGCRSEEHVWSLPLAWIVLQIDTVVSTCLWVHISAMLTTIHGRKDARMRVNLCQQTLGC